MYYLYVVLKMIVLTGINMLDVAMLARAILSWFPAEDSKLSEILFKITEPIIYPFRRLYHRMNWFQQMPIDMAFLSAMIMLSLLSFALS